MATIRPNRRVERAGVNALRALLEDHDQIVQEIDGGNDHGEDLYVSFTRSRRRTGHIVAIQVKAGKKYKRANGYAIPIEDHFEDWKQSRVPVLGVVYDPEMDSLYWVNLTKYLRACDDSPGWVPVPSKNILDAAHVRGFIAENEQYIDSAGLRVRNTDPARTLEQLVKSEDVPTSGKSTESDLPNPLFDGIADAITRIPFSGHQLRWAAAFAAVVGAMILEWPYQIEFVKTYTDMSPVRWVLNVYLFILFLFVVVYSERLAGRFAEGTARFLALVAGNFLWIPFIKGDGKDDQWWGDVWIAVGVVVPHVGEVFIVTFFVLAEIERRKGKN
ncbi:hypothetical protein GCM10010191_93810 [Actinomadura vinacea]|uniref:DUF4365 domain-containing protein n=1 Tax=Actinomadura vinacea TaxID=115336 RepID=A0ABN3KG18_9ACTN